MAQMDTLVTTRIGADYIDFWAELARETGDPEAYYNWAHCYEKSGEFSEGLIVIREMLKLPLPNEWQVKGIFLKAIFEKDTPNTAWATIQKCNMDVSPVLRGKIHSQRGRIQKDRRKYDEAILEYTAAAIYWEGNDHLIGHTWNNLAGLYIKKGQYDDAHQAVDKAIALWSDYEYLPHAHDQKALILIEEKRYAEALVYSRKSFAGIENKHRWRAEFFCTLALALAGTDQYSQALIEIENSFKVYDYLGDSKPKIKAFAARKKMFEVMHERSDIRGIEYALEISRGELRKAARHLDVNHSALLGAMKRRAIKYKHSK